MRALLEGEQVHPGRSASNRGRLLGAAMSFEEFQKKVDDIVFNHPVVTNNEYCNWVAEGNMTEEDVKDLTIQFSVFSHYFIQAQLLKCFSAQTLEQYRSGKEILMNELGVSFTKPGAADTDDPNAVPTEGTVQGCKLVCPYHGWAYDESGVAEIPHDRFGHDNVHFRIDTVPVRERYGLIFIFPGDAKLAATKEIPSLPDLEGPNPWPHVFVQFDCPGHHSMLLDNVSDFTHAYLHRRFQPFRRQGRHGKLPESRRWRQEHLCGLCP